MKSYILTILVLSSPLAIANADWGRSVSQEINCYPTDKEGQVIPNTYPISWSYCLRLWGAEWAESVDGATRCYGKVGRTGLRPTQPVDPSWCLSGWYQY